MHDYLYLTFRDAAQAESRLGGGGRGGNHSPVPGPELLTSLLGMQSELDSPKPVNVLIQLAVSVRAHGRGGSLLVVPADTQVRATMARMMTPAAA